MNLKSVVTLVFGAVLSVYAQIQSASAGALSDATNRAVASSLGTCSVGKAKSNTGDTAISIFLSGTFYFLDGTKYFDTAITNIGNPITPLVIATCLSIPEAHVTNLTVNSATGAFEDNTGMFLEFTTTNDGDGGRYAGTWRYNLPGLDAFPARFENKSPNALIDGADPLDVASGAEINLDGSISSDDNFGGSTMTYAWSQTSGPSPLSVLTTSNRPTMKYQAPTLVFGDPTQVFVIKLTVSDGTLSTIQEIQINVLPPAAPPVALTNLVLPDGIVGVPYAHDFDATGGGGTGYTFTSNNLHAIGLSGYAIGGADGVLQFTPTATGVYAFKVKVVESAGGAALSAQDEQTVTVTVRAATVPVATMMPVDKTRTSVKVGEPYNQAIVATLTPNNGFAVAYSLKSGALPAGAVLNTTTGVISGKATTVSTGSYVVLATFSNTVNGALQTYTVEKTYNFTISPSAVISLVNIAPIAGTVGLAYSHDFDASGDSAGSYRFFIAGTDVLPDGLTLNATTGVLSGVPAKAASFTFLLTAEQTSDVQNFGSMQVTMVVNATAAASPEIVKATKEIAAITIEGSQSAASTSSGIMTDTVGDALGDAFSDSPGSSPLVGYQDGAMIIVSKAKMTPAVRAIDELVVADRKATRLRAGGSVPGLFHAYGDGEGNLAAGMVDPARWSFWGSIRGSQLNTSAALNNLKGNQYNLMGGASYRWSPQVVFGGFGGYETFKYADKIGAKLSGSGYTAGAYIGYRPDNGLRFEGQLSSTWIDYGVSSGLVTGSFDANRIVASAAIVGMHSAGGFLFEPTLRVSGTWERQSAYVNSGGVLQAARSFSSSKVSSGLKVSKSFDLAGETKIMPFAGIYADYAMSSGATKGAFDDLSARAALGFNATLNQNVTFGLNGDISGLGLNDVLLMSLKAQLGIAF